LPRKKHYRKGEEREKEERGWVVVPKHETVAKPLKDRQTVTLALLCILLPVSFKSRGDREGGEGKVSWVTQALAVVLLGNFRLILRGDLTRQAS